MLCLMAARTPLSLSWQPEEWILLSFKNICVVLKSDLTGLFDTCWGPSEVLWTRTYVASWASMFLPIFLCLGTHGAVRSLCSPHAMVCSLCIRFLLCKPYKGRRDVMKMCFGSLYWKKMECHVRKSQSKEIWLKASGSEHSRQTGPQSSSGDRRDILRNAKDQQQKHYTIWVLFPPPIKTCSFKLIFVM